MNDTKLNDDDEFGTPVDDDEGQHVLEGKPISPSVAEVLERLGLIEKDNDEPSEVEKIASISHHQGTLLLSTEKTGPAVYILPQHVITVSTMQYHGNDPELANKDVTSIAVHGNDGDFRVWATAQEVLDLIDECRFHAVRTLRDSI